MLAEVVDAVVGIDTHHDSHQVEIADVTGKPISTIGIGNDSAGFACLLAWIGDLASGPRLAVSIEGSRSYGVGLARALTAARLLVIECEQPQRKQRRGKGKSDAIDAHLAVLAALRLDAARLPRPRADGDREALRILLGARQDMTTTGTAQTNRLRALLLAGDDADRRFARGALTQTVLVGLAGRRLRHDAGRDHAVRDAEIQRLALALREAHQQLTANRRQLQAIVDDIAPGITDRYGVGPVSAAQIVVSFSHPGRVRNEAAFAALSGTSPIPASSSRTVRHRLNRGGDRALNPAIHTIAVTRMQLSNNRRLRRTTDRARQKSARNPALSSDRSPASSTGS
jgi:transposase